MEYVYDHINEILSPKPRKNSLDILEDDKFKGKKIFFIGLCGGQASGKSKIANYFKTNLKNAAIIAEKNFFKQEKTSRKFSATDEPLIGEADGYSQERKMLLNDLSNPECYNHDKLIQCLEDLKEMKSVVIPTFDEDKGIAIEEGQMINPLEKNIIIVEGYFTFKDQRLCKLFDLKLYIEVDDDVRLSRLILRENVYLKNNSNAFKTFFFIYLKFLKPSYESNIAIGKKYANIILPNFEITENDEIAGDDTLEFLLSNLKGMNLVTTQK